MKKIIFLLIILFFSCKKENVKMEIANNNIETFSSNSNKTKYNIIAFSIYNPTNNIYYFSPSFGTNTFHQKMCITKQAVSMRVFKDAKKRDVELNYYPNTSGRPSEEFMSCQFYKDSIFNLNLNRLGYGNYNLYFLSDYKGFFLHPNEKKYFEYYLCLSKSEEYDISKQSSFVNLEKSKSYYATLSIASDSTNFKKYLPRDILKTIEANNVKVYHGIIESSNKVSIKVIE